MIHNRSTSETNASSIANRIRDSTVLKGLVGPRIAGSHFTTNSYDLKSSVTKISHTQHFPNLVVLTIATILRIFSN